MPFDPKVNYINARKKVLSPGDATANELFQVPNNDKIDIQEYKERYIQHIFLAARNDPPEGWKPTKECPKPYNSTARMYREHTNIRDNWKDSDALIPRGVPLQDSLSIDQENTPSWSQPLKKDLIPIRNNIIHTSRFDPVFFKESVEEFRSYGAKNQLNHLNSGLYSFTVEFVKLTPDQRNNLVQCVHDRNDCELSLQHPLLCIDYPVLFTVHNGCRSLSFNFGWFEYKSAGNNVVSDVRFLYSRLPEEVIEFLESLPILYSDEANTKIRMLERMLREIFDVNINFKVFDIASLAIAAGCRVDNLNLFALSVIVDGQPFPTGIQYMDNFWVKDSEVMPKEAKCYLKEKMMVLNNVFSTLFGLFLRQQFPDPDIVLSICEMSQLEFIYFFSEFIGQALIGSDPTRSVVNCATREDMIKSIADPYNKFVQPLCDLLADVPVAQEGGARYLHGNRYNFVNKQYDIIKRMDFHMFPCKVPNQDRDIDSLGYQMLYRREVAFDNSGVPTDEVGLLPSPEFANTIYNLDFDNIVKLERQFDRDLVPALDEWGRLNVFKIKRLLTKLRQLPTDQLAVFWIPKVRVYEMLRETYFRMTGDYIAVVELDRAIGTRVTNVRKHHEELEVKRQFEMEKAKGEFKPRAKREFKLQSMRVDFLNQRINRSKAKVGVHQRVMENIPGSNNQKNYAKRMKNDERKARRREECPPESWVGRIESRRLKQASVLANRSYNTLTSGSSSRSSATSSNDLRHRLGTSNDLRYRLDNQREKQYRN